MPESSCIFCKKELQGCLYQQSIYEEGLWGNLLIFNLQKIEDFIYHCAVQLVKLDANISFPCVNFTPVHLQQHSIQNSYCKM